MFAPIDPTSTAPAEAACLKLTEDEDVFLVTGFFLADVVLCPLETHNTAVVGGGMTPDLGRSGARAVGHVDSRHRPGRRRCRQFADVGELDGNRRIYANAADKPTRSTTT